MVSATRPRDRGARLSWHVHLTFCMKVGTLNSGAPGEAVVVLGGRGGLSSSGVDPLGLVGRKQNMKKT